MGQSSRPALAHDTIPGRSSGASGPFSVPVVDLTDPCCAKMVGIGTAVTSSEAGRLVGALVLSASAETPLLHEQAS